jgi:hypothetical protein
MMTAAKSGSVGRLYTAAELEELFEAFARQIRDARHSGEIAADQVRRLSFHGYERYREAMTNIAGISTVLEDKLPWIVDSDQHAVEARFHKLMARMLEMRAEASVEIFNGLSDAGTLPIGGREVFLVELHELSKALERLRDPEFSALVSSEVRDQISTAHHILGEIVANAPSLLVLAEKTHRKRRKTSVK